MEALEPSTIQVITTSMTMANQKADDSTVLNLSQDRASLVAETARTIAPFPWVLVVWVPQRQLTNHTGSHSTPMPCHLLFTLAISLSYLPKGRLSKNCSQVWKADLLVAMGRMLSQSRPRLLHLEKTPVVRARPATMLRLAYRSQILALRAPTCNLLPSPLNWLLEEADLWPLVAKKEARLRQRAHRRQSPGRLPETR